MNCESTRERLLEFNDGRLDAETAATVQAHLAGCPECRRELAIIQELLTQLDAAVPLAPSPQLRTGVFAAMAAEKRASGAGAAAAPATARYAPRHSPWSWLNQAIVAGGLLAIGYVAGTRWAGPRAADPGTERELAALQSQVRTMGQLVGYSLQQQEQHSTNDRLEGVLATATVRQPTPQVINDLIGALALDPSVNVRLNAVEALYAHADQEVVRTGVLISLPREESPLVQVAMIDFLVAAKDHDASPVLERISTTTTADANVREAARRALTEL
jgi:anti-sigma factor RsiW